MCAHGVPALQLRVMRHAVCAVEQGNAPRSDTCFGPLTEGLVIGPKMALQTRMARARQIHAAPKSQKKKDKSCMVHSSIRNKILEPAVYAPTRLACRP